MRILEFPCPGMTHNTILAIMPHIPPTTIQKQKNICFTPFGVRLSICDTYFCYDSVRYSPVLPPTHTACQISRKSWKKSLIWMFSSKTLQNYIFLFVKPTIWGKFNGFRHCYPPRLYFREKIPIDLQSNMEFALFPFSSYWCSLKSFFECNH